MQTSAVYQILKLVGYLVLFLGVVAIIYAAVIGASYWEGIGV